MEGCLHHQVEGDTRKPHSIVNCWRKRGEHAVESRDTDRSSINEQEVNPKFTGIHI
jgi:hypothetical protein